MSKQCLWLVALFGLMSALLLALAGTPAARAQQDAIATASPSMTATPGASVTATLRTSSTATPTTEPEPTSTPDISYALHVSGLQRPPSGSSSEVARVYYDYLFVYYYDQIPEDRATEIWTGPPTDVYKWLAVMLLIFFLYAYVFLSTHRKEGELHETTSFAGSILERGGKVSAFTWVIIALLFGLALYYIIWHIAAGYIY